MRGPGSDDPADDHDDEPDRREGPSSSDDEPRRDRTDHDREDGRSTRSETSARSDADGREDGVDPIATRVDDRARSREGSVTIEEDGYLRWFVGTDDGTVVAIRDVVTTVAIVALVGAILFGISGVWPPLVAVESGSMEPSMERGDLIFVVDGERFVGDDPIEGTGIVTHDNGLESGHEKFGQAGDVVVFTPDGEEFRTPVIHRAHFWVEEGENWVDTRADPENLNGRSCVDVTACPAEHDGFVTKGDANSGYDQAGSGAQLDYVVKPEWVTGKASQRLPWLGHVRLTVDEILASTTLGVPGSTPATPGSTVPATPAPLEVGLFAIGSAVAIAGSRRPGSW